MVILRDISSLEGHKNNTRMTYNITLRMWTSIQPQEQQIQVFIV